MGKFLDALMNKPAVPSTTITAATTGQPLPVAMIRERPSDLTSGSAFSHAAIGAWPDPTDNSIKLFNSWKKNSLKPITTHNAPANYGSVTSASKFGFRFRAFNGIGNYSGPVPNPYVKEYNELVPIVWNIRVGNPNTIANTTAQKGPISVQTTPTTWQGASTASLSKSGVTLL